MKRVILTGLLMLAATLANATAQIPDLIVVDGQRQPLFFPPAVDWAQVHQQAPAVAPKGGGCTASWRGYQAIWTVEDQRLYLSRINENPCSSGEKDEIALQPPVFAGWVSRQLLLPQGERLRYVHMGFESVYERYLLLTVEKGRVVKQTLCDPKDKDAILAGKQPPRPLQERCPMLGKPK